MGAGESGQGPGGWAGDLAGFLQERLEGRIDVFCIIKSSCKIDSAGSCCWVLAGLESARSGTTCPLGDRRARSNPGCSSNAILFPSARTWRAQKCERACISVRWPKPRLDAETHGNHACSLVCQPFAGIRARSSFAVAQCRNPQNKPALTPRASIQGDHGSPLLARRAATEAARDPWPQFSGSLDPNVLARF